MHCKICLKSLALELTAIPRPRGPHLGVSCSRGKNSRVKIKQKTKRKYTVALFSWSGGAEANSKATLLHEIRLFKFQMRFHVKEFNQITKITSYRKNLLSALSCEAFFLTLDVNKDINGLVFSCSEPGHKKNKNGFCVLSRVGLDRFVVCILRTGRLLRVMSLLVGLKLSKFCKLTFFFSYTF